MGRRRTPGAHPDATSDVVIHDVWFWLRLLNYFLYGGVLTGVLMHSRRLVIPAWPGFRWGLWGFLAASAYATAEVMFKGLPGGPRIVLLTVPLAVLFIGCWLPAVRRQLTRRRRTTT